MHNACVRYELTFLRDQWGGGETSGGGGVLGHQSQRNCRVVQQTIKDRCNSRKIITICNDYRQAIWNTQ